MNFFRSLFGSRQQQQEEKPATPKTRSTNIEDIEGIGPAHAEKLKAAEITTIESLLEKGATRKGREQIAATTEISSTLILEWVNLADLFRIKGIGSEYSDLLEEAGVDTVKELAQRNAENLHAKLESINSEKQLVRRTPTLDAVKDWIEQAKTLPRMVEY
jgi:predicted flap endonuclease-1-like 5' DNA nuclease